MVIITICNYKILLCLHYFLTPQFQTFTNLPIGIFGVSNPTVFCLFVCLFVCLFFGGGFRFLRNYVSILVNIISNNAVLQCYLLWIFVLIRRLLQLIVCIGVSTPPHLKNTTPSFTKSSLKSANYPSPSFLGDSPPPPPPSPQKIHAHLSLPPKSDFSVNSHNIKLFNH